MSNDLRDIQKAMGSDSQRSGDAGNPESNPAVGTPPLEPAEFSSRLEPLRRTLWLIAASILGGGPGAGRGDAEDVVQEAAVIALRKLDEFDPSTARGGDGGFAAWMGQIVRNVARNQARKQARRRTVATDPGDMDRAGSGASGLARLDEAHDVELDQHVLDALNELDEIPRTCLLLRTVRDLPYREISNVLGIPEGTAMSHVHRARKTLRARLSQSVGPAGAAGSSAAAQDRRPA